MNYRDAKYVISEIRNIEYYERTIKELDDKIDSIGERIGSATDPRSPNGGVDIVKNGKIVMRYKVGGGGGSAESVMNSLITAQMRLQKKKDMFSTRKAYAEQYKKQLEATRHRAFVKDFFDQRMTYKGIEAKHYCSNAYSKMAHIIMDTIKTI